MCTTMYFLFLTLFADGQFHLDDRMGFWTFQCHIRCCSCQILFIITKNKCKKKRFVTASAEQVLRYWECTLYNMYSPFFKSNVGILKYHATHCSMQLPWNVNLFCFCPFCLWCFVTDLFICLFNSWVSEVPRVCMLHVVYSGGIYVMCADGFCIVTFAM